jgi:phosphoribosylglycinamide formyltransferase 1
MRIAVLAGKGSSSNILINRLRSAGHREISVVFEDPQSRLAMIRRRMRVLGLTKTVGQLAFLAVVPPLLARLSRRRREAILAAHGLSADPPVDLPCLYVASVNDDAVVAHLTEHRPDVVLVNGTRIISRRVLEAVDAPFINTHVGITPRYRGVHGGYWALRNRDRENFGVTVHLVDAGVDTGGVLVQARPRPDPQDNFATYPLLQQAASLAGLLAVLQALERGEALKPMPGEGPSRQWYHPTLVEYLLGRLIYGVR